MFHKPKEATGQNTTTPQGENTTMSAQNNQNADNNQARPLDLPGSAAFQPRAGAGLTGNTAAAGRGRKLIIGEGINLSGQIDSCDHLIVEGTVEAELRNAQMLEIFESGVYYGTGEIEQATIAGRFEGDLTISGRLVVKSSGVIVGSISYGELAVEAGATIEGKISPLSSAAASKKSSSPSVDFSKGKAAARQGEEEGLPFNNGKQAANG